MAIDNQFLITIQDAYSEYRKLEEELECYLDKKFSGKINSIHIYDNKVTVDVSYFNYGWCEKTYVIPFSYFNNYEIDIEQYKR